MCAPSLPPPPPIYFQRFAKEKFDYHCAELHGSLPNTPAAHRRFLAMLAPGTHVVCESTGHYHRALVGAAHAAGVALTVANPQQVRFFAKGLGRRAKTDPIDAQTLADFGRVTLPKADLARARRRPRCRSWWWRASRSCANAAPSPSRPPASSSRWSKP